VRHFVKALLASPYFRNDRDGERRSADYKVVLARDTVTANLLRAFLVSSAYYLYFIALSDAYHCGRDLVLSFPVGVDVLPKSIAVEAAKLGVLHEEDLYAHSKRRRIKYRTTGWIEYDEFYPRESKAVVDRIDELLASHFGFTPEELDYVINYDIKYRMGVEGEGEADDE
jgi:hypothetical protein